MAIPVDYGRMIREAVAELRARLEQRIANLVQQTQITNPTSDGNEDGVDGWPSEAGRYQRAPKRWQHFGFRSVPPKNTAALMILVGGGATAEVTVAEDSAGYGPDPGPGGVAIFSQASGAYVTIDKDGQVTVQAGAGKPVNVNAGSGGDVVVNGATLPVARQTDPTADGALALTSVTTTPGGIPTNTVTITYTPPTGAPQTVGVLVFAAGLLVSATNGSGAIVGNITSGAPHFKGQ